MFGWLAIRDSSPECVGWLAHSVNWHASFVTRSCNYIRMTNTHLQFSYFRVHCKIRFTRIKGLNGGHDSEFKGADNIALWFLADASVIFQVVRWVGEESVRLDGQALTLRLRRRLDDNRLLARAVESLWWHAAALSAISLLRPFKPSHSR